MAQAQIFHDAQTFLSQENLPGWLIYDFRNSNPIFRQVITPSGHVTRPCYLFVPASGSQPEDQVSRELSPLRAGMSRGAPCRLLRDRSSVPVHVARGARPWGPPLRRPRR